MANINLPFAASATRRAPTSEELASGFGCGDADKALFDWLAWYQTVQIGSVITGAGLMPDDADPDQLLDAIRALTRDTARSQVTADRGASSQATADSVITRVTGFGTVASGGLLGGSTFSGGILTIGAGDAGLWFLSAHCRQTFSNSSGLAVYLYKNSTQVASDGGPAAVAGSIVHGNAARAIQLAAGDTIDMRVIQTTGGSFTFNDLYSLSAVRIGA